MIYYLQLNDELFKELNDYQLDTFEVIQSIFKR